jgi:hypothetical protein
VSVTEGNSGTSNATFTVSLSAASGQAVSVNWATANGTATAPDDYTAGNGTLTFNAGETTKQFNITVFGDTLVEPNETFHQRRFRRKFAIFGFDRQCRRRRGTRYADHNQNRRRGKRRFG